MRDRGRDSSSAATLCSRHAEVIESEHVLKYYFLLNIYLSRLFIQGLVERSSRLFRPYNAPEVRRSPSRLS